jgi:hypothetical protein
LVCCITFDIFVEQAVAGGGQMSLGGIQFAKDVEIIQLFPQQTTSFSLLGRQASWGDCSEGINGKQCEVVKGGGGGWVAFPLAGHRKIST